MATSFSPCKGPYVLNQFPSNVMFGMKGFHILASGAIQGHHGPLVLNIPSPQTTGLIWTKLGRNVLWEVQFYKLFTEFGSIKFCGCDGNQMEFFKQFFKNLFL